MKLLFLGDFFYDYDFFPEDFERISRWIKENDYKVVLNLESSFGNKGNPVEKRGPNIKSSPLFIEALKKLNVVCVCLANNHAMDYGWSALKEEISLLDNAGILHTGAGSNLKEAENPAIFELGGKKIILHNYGWDVEETVYASDKRAGCAGLDHDRIIQLTKKSRIENPDALLVNIFHWGFEFNTLPMPIDINLAHKSIESGANLVIGHHPHVMQPHETWNKGEIFYSLGNFYFSSMRDSYTREFHNEPFINMCDYGLGVIYDIVARTYQCIQIEYNKVVKESNVSEELSCLNDISGVDGNSDEYYNEAKKHSSGVNPILTLDNKKNKEEIERLDFRYSVAKKIAFLKKSRAGKAVYNFLKKATN